MKIYFERQFIISTKETIQIEKTKQNDAQLIIDSKDKEIKNAQLIIDTNNEKIVQANNNIKQLLSGDTRGGASSNSIKILGRNRKVTIKGRSKYITYNGELITLTAARKLEKIKQQSRS